MKKLIFFPAFLCIIAVAVMSFKTNKKSPSGIGDVYVINNIYSGVSNVRLRDASNGTYIYGVTFGYPYTDLWTFHMSTSASYFIEAYFDNTIAGDYHSVGWGGYGSNPNECEQHTSASGAQWNQLWSTARTFQNGQNGDIVLWASYDCQP